LRLFSSCRNLPSITFIFISHVIFNCRTIEYQTVWRGVPEDLSVLYPKGREFVWWAVSSCTSSISVLESPSYVGTSGPRTMFSIETSSGKVVGSHSYFQQEDEVILPPGRYLKVIDKSSPTRDLHIIHLREIAPPYPMLTDPFDFSEFKNALPQLKPLPSSSSSNQKMDHYEKTNVVSKRLPSSSSAHQKQTNSVASSVTSESSVPVFSKKGKFTMLYLICRTLSQKTATKGI
jgi:hypothetical protein